MLLHPQGSIAVIFCAQRTALDNSGYDAAASEMSTLAASQPGYLGQDHSRSPDGLGITVSYWQDEAAAKAWRDHPDHAAIRDRGRDIWYQSYSLHVATIDRRYGWEKSGTDADSMP